MKKVLLPILALVLALGLALPMATPVGANPDPGLVALWHLDERTGTIASDSSGNSNNGTLTNMDTATCWVSGKFGNALDFDGSNDYVLVPDDPSLNPSGNMTIEAWFKTTDTSGGMIVNKDGVSANRQYDIHLNVDGGLATNFWSPARAHVNTKEIGIPTNYNDGVWHHVAATFNAGDGKVRLYIDGVLVGTSSETISSVNPTTENVWIGNRRNSPLPFDGLIDEVRIWDQALTDDQIQASYDLRNGTQIKEKDLDDDGYPDIILTSAFCDLTSGDTITATILPVNPLVTIDDTSTHAHHVTPGNTDGSISKGTLSTSGYSLPITVSQGTPPCKTIHIWLYLSTGDHVGVNAQFQR